MMASSPAKAGDPVNANRYEDRNAEFTGYPAFAGYDDHWQSAFETNDSFLHSPSFGWRFSSQTTAGHFCAEVMSIDLPALKPLVWHSATLAASQSGAPLAADGQACQPETVEESGSRATVPAASPTPFASSPAVLLAPPTASPAPRMPAPTFDIDWSMKRPIDPMVSPGVGSRGSAGADGPCGEAACGAPACGSGAACGGALAGGTFGGAVITGGGSAGGGGADDWAHAGDARLAKASATGMSANLKVLRMGGIMAERGRGRHRVAARPVEPGCGRKPQRFRNLTATNSTTSTPAASAAMRPSRFSMNSRIGAP